jgi:O-antigen/teichoic acid export membrane protein
LHSFATWLYASGPSTLIRSQEVWIIPTIQSIHIVGIATAVGSGFMIAMRVTGWMGADQTLLQTQRRYGPWLAGALWLLLATGLLLVLAEPPRELDAISFWVKMALVALMAVIAFTFQRSVRRDDQRWETTILRRTGVKWAALLTFLVWAAIIFLGRFIAYDQIWNRVFPGIKG